MKKINNKEIVSGNSIVIILFSIITLLLVSCGGKGNKQVQDDKYPALNSGTISVCCDEAIYDLLDRPFKMYDSVYTDVKLTVVKTTARQAMANLLAGITPVIFLSRDYLKDEDSLMKQYKITPYQRMLFAEDALVFYTKNDFPLDTITDAQLKEVFLDKNLLKKIYPKLQKEPEFVINNQVSSEYANLKSLVLKNNVPKRKLLMFAGYDSVKKFVLQTNYAIGIGYLSQVIKDTNLKCLKIAFNDSTGKRVFPHLAHQANIVRRFYPYIVSHYVYFLEDRRNLPWWLGTFIAKEAIVQRYYKDAGIVPGYAVINLIEEE
ncbi:MAG: substrate-binding domain-containing protein [FCB group bacterium]|jgi:ABC-type phosphate transport system substrate-binding protein